LVLALTGEVPMVVVLEIIHSRDEPKESALAS
jgi:hypothetical protein